MIRFEQTVEGVQHTVVEIPNEVDMQALANAVIAFVLALGYHPDTVKEYFGEPS